MPTILARLPSSLAQHKQGEAIPVDKAVSRFVCPLTSHFKHITSTCKWKHV